MNLYKIISNTQQNNVIFAIKNADQAQKALDILYSCYEFKSDDDKTSFEKYDRDNFSEDDEDHVLLFFEAALNDCRLSEEVHVFFTGYTTEEAELDLLKILGRDDGENYGDAYDRYLEKYNHIHLEPLDKNLDSAYKLEEKNDKYFEGPWVLSDCIC